MYDYDQWDEDVHSKALDEVWTVPMLAERWHIKARTVREMLYAGELNGFKVRKDWRIYLSEILRYEGEDPKTREHLRPQAVTPMPKPVVLRIT